MYPDTRLQVLKVHKAAKYRQPIFLIKTQKKVLLTSEETQQMEEYTPNQQLKPHVLFLQHWPRRSHPRDPKTASATSKTNKTPPPKKKFQQGNDSSFHFLPLIRSQPTKIA